MSSTDERTGLLRKLRARINPKGSWLSYDLGRLLPARATLDDAALDEIEDELLLADAGIETARAVTAALRAGARDMALTDVSAVRHVLSETLTRILLPVQQPLEVEAAPPPFVILMVGVNGTGKTTTIGKLAGRLKSGGYSVMLAAGDTFRAAAVEQLQVWGKRLDVPVIAQKTGADPAAVAHDALTAARSRGNDVLIIDTAGRLHTQSNLMAELAKIRRVLGGIDPDAPQETLLVLDAGTGQNALVQIRQFKEAVGVTGLVVTKLDGTARGGILFAAAKEFSIPIRFIGVGEAMDDLEVFAARPYVDALLARTDHAEEVGG